MKVRDYKELEVWKKGIEIVDRVYNTTDTFPHEERFGLAAHLRKTGISIPSNIAEGFARQHRKEYRQFLFIALGSCAELETQLIIAQRRSYLSQEDMNNMAQILGHESRMLMSLIKVLEV